MYPLIIAVNLELGVDFTLSTEQHEAHGYSTEIDHHFAFDYARIDLDFVTRLDAASTSELAQSRDNLKPLEHGLTRHGI